MIDFLKREGNIYDAGFAVFQLHENGMIEMIVDNSYSITTDDVWEMQDFLAKHKKQEFRVCEVCGKPYDAGYMHEGGFHACSEECVKRDADERYGKGNWKWCDDWTDEEKERFQSDEEVGCLIYKDEDGNWELDNTFYTEWF